MAVTRSVAILVIGAGPTGLGAAHRLSELHFDDFLVVEAADRVGGLATSYQDPVGFTWDVGGHVVHSHYPYFDQVFQTALADQTYTHQRESWVWLFQKFIPYPFQNNLRHLPKTAIWECLHGLLKRSPRKKRPTSFRDWIIQQFGQGIAHHFLFPYNSKVWCHPLEKMNATWVGDRVSPIDLEKALETIVLEKDDVAWGPNHVFYFPKQGGTGTLWETIARAIPTKHFWFDKKVVALDAQAKVVTLQTGETLHYQHLISSIPLHHLVALTKFTQKPSALAPQKIRAICQSSSVTVIGIGLEGVVDEQLKTKCWMYYPESQYPFFRVTIFSNYSPANVPNAKTHWSIMCEVAQKQSHSTAQQQQFSQPPIDSQLVAKVVAGLFDAKLITHADTIISTWMHTAPLGYPIPTLKRDTYIDPALQALETYEIYSRGRFGAWKYEVSNMDHTFMQGVEVANRLITHQKEAEITVWHPNQVNQRSG